MRQYTQLMTLMNNYDFYKENVERAKNSEGSLQEQADIYADSWDAAKDRVQASAEAIYKSLINDQFFIEFNNKIGDIYGKLNSVQKQTVSLFDTDRNGMLDARGAYCYCGCLEGRGFDECGEKGFVLVDIDEYTRHATYEFIPFGYRTLYTIPVDVSGVMTTQEASQKVENVISELGYSSRSMVKIVLCGEVDVDCEINCQFLQDMFQNYFYYEKVYDETSLLIKYSDYEKDVSLKGEFIRMVLNSDLDEEKKSEVIRCGIQALIGEEI